MALFNLFGKKDKKPDKPAPAPAASAAKEDTSAIPAEVLPYLPKFHDGMKIEVLTPENQLIYIGRLEVIRPGVLQVHEDEGSRLPPVATRWDSRFMAPKMLLCIVPTGSAENAIGWALLAAWMM